MRIDLYTNENNLSTGNVTIPGMIMTGPLYINEYFDNNFAAVPKSFIDNALLNLNANNITNGTLSASRFPGFKGDATSTIGSNIINLVNSGVTPGTYTKVLVDAKGRVYGNDTLTDSDIESIDWNKITTDKPTTLEGYGITDGVRTDLSETINGNLTLYSDPVNNLHAATKQYVDNLSSSSGGYSVGDIIRRPNNTTPTGFLRCNGAQVSKTTYANLYAVIGDTYSYSLQPGSGKPWKQQYDINTDQSGDITGWTIAGSLPDPLGASQAIVTKNRVYLLGGWSGSSVYTAPINTDGTLGTWTIGTPLPGPVSHSQAIVTKNRVYLLGGSDGNNTRSTVYTAPINTDGTLGTWTTSAPLPGTLHDSQAIVTKNRVYLLGGDPSGGYTSTATVYTAPINTDGTLGTWTIGTPLPGPVSQSQAIVTKNRVYLIGGHNGTSFISTVYTAPINSDGTLGTWTTGTPLPNVLDYSQAIVTKNRVYLLGGRNGSGPVSTVYTAPILGGLNDYSPYFDGTSMPTDPNNFRLPDYINYDRSDLISFIKY